MTREEILLAVPPFLLNWYDSCARVLPWREDPQPYRVWVSEIMLQQTRVEAVKPYYERFLDELPDIASLANASEEQLLKLWEGLGYYNRVRALQKAAQAVVAEFGGELPASYEKLLSLPGFGEYTAGAVASIAFGIPVPAVDGNVLRVISRLAASYDDVTKPAVKAGVAEALRKIIPADRAGDFNQSLMELGAMVCLPNGEPKCEECPLASLCEGYRQGIAASLPKKPPKKSRRKETHTVFVLLSEGRCALRKRPDNGLLASLWEFPNVEGSLSRTEAEAYLRDRKLEIDKIQSLRPAKHIFSHVEWEMPGYLVRVTAPAGEFVWMTEEQFRVAALPSAFKAFTREAEQAFRQK